MKQYLDILQTILDNGREKESGRANMPNTIGITGASIKMDLRKGFPLITTKKIYIKGVIIELLWFLKGDTNIKYLVDNNVNIWNDDAFRWYNEKYVKEHNAPKLTIDEFLKKVKDGAMYSYPDKNGFTMNVYKYGDLGKVYGYQWRNQNGVDQINRIINGLKTNPYSRYHILDAWNISDFNKMALPPCHLLYHFIVRPLTIEERVEYVNVLNENKEYTHDDLDKLNAPKFYLDLNMYQRSADMFLGVPFNLASMSLLLMIIAKTCNMIAGTATWIGGDVHLYKEHIPMAMEQLKRKPYPSPKLNIKKELNTIEDIENLTFDDFEIMGYYHHDAIKAELFTGLKK